MNWISKLERKIGRYAIPNLMYYIIGLYILGFVIVNANPQIYYDYLSLSASAILHGQIWRIVTFIVAPPATSVISMFFFCLLYYSIGNALEYKWGSFRFNLYYFVGMILHVIAALLIYIIAGRELMLDTSYLNLSLFLAYGVEFPDNEILLFFILPIKMKWLALLDGIYFAITIISGFLPISFGIAGSMAASVAALVAFGNFLIFFFGFSRYSYYTPMQVKRKKAYITKVKHVEKHKNGRPRHKCAICGRTEEDGDLEFRYCSKCEGTYEYCQEHLYTHKHVTKD